MTTRRMMLVLAVLLGFAFCGNVQAADLTWDHNADGTASDGAGTWLNANQWLDGETPATWNNTTPDNATIGSGGEGGAITLGTVTAGTVLLDNFTDTYTLSSGSIEQSGGVTVGSSAGNVTINTTISGAGGLTMNGSGLLKANSSAAVMTYTGPTVLNSGVMMLHGPANRSTGNFTLNGGMLTDYYRSTHIFSSGLGTGDNQIQIYGDSGFGGGNANSNWRIGAQNSVLTWGSTYFNPTTLKFLAPFGDNMGPTIYGTVTLQNGLDLNGGARTIDVFSSGAEPFKSTATIGVIQDTVGGGGLIKTGAGNLILGNANTYSGTTTINEGWITASASDRLGDGSAANTLIFNGGTLRATGTITSPSTRGVTMTSTGIIDNNGQAISIAGDIGGAGGLTKIGNGTLTLTGTSTHTGTITVSAGTLRVDSPGSLHASSTVSINGGILDGTGSINGPVNVAVGGTLSSTNLTYGGLVTGTAGAAYFAPAGLGTLGTVTLSAGLTLNAGNAFECDLGNTSGSSDVIAITGDLTLNGTSYVAFSVPTGSAAENATYTIMTWTGIKAGTGTLVFPNGTTTMNGATLTIGANSVTITTGGSGITTGDRNVTWSGSSSYVWDSSTANWLDGATPTAYAYGDNVTFDDSGLAASPITGTPAAPASVTVNTSSKTYTISASIGGAGGLTKSGTSTLTLSGVNTFTGDISIDGGGVTLSTLDAWGGSGKNVTFTGSGTLTSTADGYSGGVLAVNSGTATIGNNSITFASSSGSGMISFLGGNNSTKLLTLGNASAFTGTLRNNIGGHGGHADGKRINFTSLGDAPGAGNLQIAGSDGNSQQAARFNVYGDAAPLTFSHRRIEWIPRSSGNGPERLELNNINANADNKWVINTDFLNNADRDHNFQLGGSNTGDNEFAGVIGDSTNGAYYLGSGILSLIKAGNGRWILSGQNTYTGITIVNGGTLVLRGEESIADTGTLNITGGKVELETREAIAVLQINGTPVASGIWGTTASGAPNVDDLNLSGTGKLYVGEPFPPSGTVLILR